MPALPRRVAALAAVAALAVLPGAAHAAAGQESTFQDDNSLIFNTPEGTAKTLDTLAELGVDRIRVSLFWATVAPMRDSRTKPSFDATDPAAYPPGSWDRYDQVVRLAKQRGIAVTFNVTSPAPLWATDPSTPREDIAATYQPDPGAFEQFVEAAGRRYNGTYAATRATPRQDPPLCALFNTCPSAQPTPAGQQVPRVDSWSVWNEPNQPGWLTPQWVEGAQGGFAQAAPRLYRGLVDAAFTGLTATGHADDQILIGETAPKGLLNPGVTAAVKALDFIRNLYCVDEAFQPLTGDRAAVRGCPEDPTQFPALHPGLFSATGYAHHPYALYTAPSVKPSDDDFVTISALPRLSRILSRIFAAYGKGTAGLPLYLTEFGYNTEPPNPAGVSLAQQAAYLNESEFIARQNPAVKTLAQFLLVDDKRRTGEGTAGYGTTFQTGLQFEDGRAKPSLRAYELPVWLPRTRVTKGSTLRVWGLVRPTTQIGKAQRVQVTLKRGTRTRVLRTVRTSAAGVLDLRVRFTTGGTLRLRWTDPRGKRVVVSRAVTVQVRRAR